MATLAAAFVLRAFGRVALDELVLLVSAALVVIVACVVGLALYIVGYHVIASAREARRQERVRTWSNWWRGRLQHTRRDVAEPLPREALEAFLELRELVSPEESAKLVELGSSLGVPRLLSRPLESRSLPRRLASLEDLARARMEGAWPALLRALGDPEPMARRLALRGAARTLARIPIERRAAPVDAFVRALHRVELPSPLVAEALLLLEDAAAEVVEPLLSSRETPAPVLHAALATTGRRDLRGLGSMVVAWALDPDPETRAAALRGLAGMGALPETGREVVEASVEDEKPFVRVHAVRAAALLPRESAIDLLWNRLGDASWWVRLAAAEALGTLGAEGRSTLERAVEVHPDRFARDIARQALADLRWRIAA